MCLQEAEIPQNKELPVRMQNKISSRGYEPIMKMKYSEFCFYIKPGKKVVVCFGPYQPMGGNGKSSITMKGKIN